VYEEISFLRSGELRYLAPDYVHLKSIIIEIKRFSIGKSEIQ